MAIELSCVVCLIWQLSPVGEALTETRRLEKSDQESLSPFFSSRCPRCRSTQHICLAATPAVVLHRQRGSSNGLVLGVFTATRQSGAAVPTIDCCKQAGLCMRDRNSMPSLCARPIPFRDVALHPITTALQLSTVPSPRVDVMCYCGRLGPSDPVPFGLVQSTMAPRCACP
ncbi:hypothetical protein B0H67DRAFT_256361 [Lasiosphaeris hirsuta]|uniref:Secreted protein n=1 Tax=Lasiosphaeris hirsuta TaxID=260670 RepID=A0AA40AHP5_9PEZI|nr:hypothetical protein B0H67DRAFT_256361 [Lasiosphaeris hirsuta]